MTWIVDTATLTLLAVVVAYVLRQLSNSRQAADKAQQSAEARTLPVEVQTILDRHCEQCKGHIMTEFQHGENTMIRLSKTLDKLDEAREKQLEVVHQLEVGMATLTTEVKNLCNEVRKSTNGAGNANPENKGV